MLDIISRREIWIRDKKSWACAGPRSARRVRSPCATQSSLRRSSRGTRGRRSSRVDRCSATRARGSGAARHLGRASQSACNTISMICTCSVQSGARPRPRSRVPRAPASLPSRRGAVIESRIVMGHAASLLSVSSPADQETRRSRSMRDVTSRSSRRAPTPASAGPSCTGARALVPPPRGHRSRIMVKHAASLPWPRVPHVLGPPFTVPFQAERDAIS